MHAVSCAGCVLKPTPERTILFEEIVFAQLVKELLAFCANRDFITVPVIGPHPVPTDLYPEPNGSSPPLILTPSQMFSVRH
jgi:hypothetical protein